MKKNLLAIIALPLKGHVEGTDIEAVANVTVEGLQVAEEISLTLPKGETVQLPANVSCLPF